MTNEVFDASALLQEIKAEALPFKLGDETFQLPTPTSWDDDVIEAANRGDVVGAARMILGVDAYPRFVAAGGNALFLQRLVEKMYGATLGESSGSSRS